jgi:probable rRNA maturation factor
MIDFINESENSTYDGVLTDLDIIMQSMTGKEIELMFVDNEFMQNVNLEQRGIDAPTDVLSFPIEMPHSELIGTLLISLDMAQNVAQAMNHSVEAEIKLLFIHGLLHLLGYDHETDEGQMRAEEEILITEFKLPHSLIVRSL